eukprot:6192424-Pleurochrysis_carterae.AAC.3
MKLPQHCSDETSFEPLSTFRLDAEFRALVLLLRLQAMPSRSALMRHLGELRFSLGEEYYIHGFCQN